MDRNVTLNIRWLLLVGLVALALVAAYLLGNAGPAPAQAETADTPRTITVTGTGHVSVVPDQLAFDLSVSVLRDDLDQALEDGNAAMQSVVDTLHSAGVADKDVQTTNVSMYPEYAHGKGQPRTLRGYRVSQSVAVTVEDLSKASSVVTAALAAGGTGVQLDDLRLQVGDPDGALQPARSDAVKQARAKAEDYAADTGRELGDVVRISEVPDTSYADQMDFGGAADAARSAASVPIQPGQADLTADVVVVYELK